MFCKRCGSGVDTDFAFCSQCGLRVRPTEPASSGTSGKLIITKVIDSSRKVWPGLLYLPDGATLVTSLAHVAHASRHVPPVYT